MNADPAEAIWLEPQHLRLLEKAGIYFIVLALRNRVRFELIKVSTSTSILQCIQMCRESACVHTLRRKVKRDIKAVTGLLFSLDKLVTLVHIFFARFQIEPVQVSLNLYSMT